MKKRIARVDPYQLGKVLAAVYACIALIFVPFLLIGAIAGFGQHQGGGAAGFLILAILAPVFYGVFGFVGGLIAAVVYNLVAGWTGGIELTLTDVAPALPGAGQYGTIQQG